MKIKTVDAARGKWRGILSGLGVDDSYLVNRHGPCPICNAGKDRWRWDDKDGTGSYYCSGHGAGNGITLAMDWTGLPFAELAKKIDGMIGNIEPDIKPSKKPADLSKIFSRSTKAKAGIVERYLKSRGLEVPQNIGECLAYDYWEVDDNNEFQKVGTYPLMVASVRDVNNQIVAAHITFLDGDSKAPVRSARKIHGEPSNSPSARLYDHTPSLGIAEGIESAVAAKMLYGINTWAALNTTLLEKFTPPEGTTELTIFADNDKNFAGQKAAYSLANRLSKTGLTVNVIVPDVVGYDFNDVLLAQRGK